MAYDSITTAAVAAELRERLPHGRVDRVIQPSAYAVALFVRAAGANHTLLLSAHPQQARVTLTAERLAKAFDEPSPFVMLLRKHLEGATLTDVARVGRDRILRLTFDARPCPVTLVAEIMAKHSNVILLDDADVILGAVKSITSAISRYRVVLPRHPYVLPPAQTQPPPREDRPKLDPLETPPEALAAALDDPASRSDATPLATALLDVLAGLSPQAAKEIAYRVSGDAGTPLGAWRDKTAEILSVARGLIDPPRWQPSIARSAAEGKILGWAAYPLTQHGVVPDLYPSIAAVLDEVYRDVESGDALGSTRAGLRAAVEGHRTRLSKKAASLRAGLRPRAELDALRVQGEMVLAFAHEIAPGQRELRLDDPPVRVALDPTLSPTENARAIFGRYRKIRDAQEKVPPLLEAAEDDLQFLDAALLFVEQADSPQALKEIRDDVGAAGFPLPGAKAPPAQKGQGGNGGTGGNKGKGGKYHPGGKEAPKKGAAPALRFTTSEGLEVLVGRSARQNEVVTFDLAASGDMWMHARGMPGSHVVLKTGGRTPSDGSVEQAAALAAYYSRGRGSTTVPVDIAPARNVRRVKGGKPGLVRISGETTINVHPLSTI